MIRKELWELHKRLDKIEEDISAAKETLEKYFTKEEQQILAYEASIGRTGAWMDSLTSEERERYAALCQQYLRFGAEIDTCLAGKMKQETAVWVGKIPDILIEAGCREADLYITQKHLRNITHNPYGKKKSKEHYHGIEVEQVKQLPELLGRPLIVASAANQPETIVVVLDGQDKRENQLIVPIRKNGHAFYQGNRVEANFILSVYGKENLACYLEKAAKEKRLLFVEKNISTNSGRKPLRLRQFLSKGTYENILQHSTEDVNIPAKKSGGIIRENKGMDRKDPKKRL